MAPDKLLNKTSKFLQETRTKAQMLSNRYDALEVDLGAYEVDYANFIGEILALCLNYEHCVPV